MKNLYELIFKRAHIFLLKSRAKLNGEAISIGQNSKISSKATIKVGFGSISIGSRFRLHQYALLDTYGGSIEIGQDVSVNPYSILYGHGGLKIGSFVRIAAHVVIIPSNHKYKEKNNKIMYQGEEKVGITIEDDVWIGAGAKILDGSYIREGCVIGANCVVNGGTEPFGVYVGVPYKKKAERTN